MACNRRPGCRSRSPRPSAWCVPCARTRRLRQRHRPHSRAADADIALVVAPALAADGALSITASGRLPRAARRRPDDGRATRPTPGIAPPASPSASAACAGPVLRFDSSCRPRCLTSIGCPGRQACADFPRPGACDAPAPWLAPTSRGLRRCHGLLRPPLLGLAWSCADPMACGAVAHAACADVLARGLPRGSRRHTHTHTHRPQVCRTFEARRPRAPPPPPGGQAALLPVGPRRGCGVAGRARVSARASFGFDQVGQSTSISGRESDWGATAFDARRASAECGESRPRSPPLRFRPRCCAVQTLGQALGRVRLGRHVSAWVRPTSGRIRPSVGRVR